MEANSQPNMALQILRRSSQLFLRRRLHHHNPTVNASIFSILVLLYLNAASYNISTSSTETIHRRLQSILLASGFPVSSSSFHFHLLNLSQLSFSYPEVSFVPLLFIFLHMSKSATIEFLKHPQQTPSPPYPSFYPLLHTHLCCTFLLIALNSVPFFLLRSFFVSTIDPLLSAAGSVFYFVAVTIAVVVCNIALISSGWEGKGGFLAILRAVVLIRGRVCTALVLALPANLAMAAVEAVLTCIAHGIDTSSWISVCAVFAGILFLSVVYGVLVVGDTVAGCLFYRSCCEEEKAAGDFKNLSQLEDGIQIQ